MNLGTGLGTGTYGYKAEKECFDEKIHLSQFAVLVCCYLFAGFGTNSLNQLLLWPFIQMHFCTVIVLLAVLRER